MVFRFKWSSEYQVSSFFVLTFNKYLVTTGKIYYRPGYRRYNLTVRKGNAVRTRQHNTGKVAPQEEAGYTRGCICVRSSKRCINQEYSVDLKRSTPKEQATDGKCQTRIVSDCSVRAKSA